MIAKVIAVDPDAKVKHYDVTKLTVTTDKGEEKDYNFFKNHKAIAKVNSLQRGQDIEITMEKNGKYWNPVDVNVIAAAAAASGGASGGSFNKADFRSKEEIRRTACLEAASRLLKQGTASNVAIQFAQEFETYLESGINPADLLDTADGE